MDGTPMTSPLSPEAVAQMVADLDLFSRCGAMAIDAKAMLTTLAAENATLRASEAAALEALAEIGAVVAAIEGADSLDKELIRNLKTRIAALTPTSDKE